MLFTNSNARGDFIRNALMDAARIDEPVFVATAFFTDYGILKSIAQSSHRVRLVVRLGYPTSPIALGEALKDPYVDIRFFTDHSFHPKLYIFGDRLAYLGSANLTSAAVISNQEILAAIPAEDDRFEDLAALFGEYWEQASVLTSDALAKYRLAFDSYKEIDAGITELEKKVDVALGRVYFTNIDRGKQKKTKENVFIDSYRRTYQEGVSAFNFIRQKYVEYGKRKVSESELPLRLEIDSFFSFVRDHIAYGEKWMEPQLGWNDGHLSALIDAFQQWHAAPFPHLESKIIHENYPRLRSVFETEGALQKADDQLLFEALLTLHSFHDSLRFHKGGIPGLREAFIDGNDPTKVRNSLAYLVHGKDEVVQRMANLIYNADYKLNSFATANVQEMIGWQNKDELPVINGRTTKILRYFGFDVRQLK
ncbi:phospholipase D family protein [Rhodanobacter sp. DHG33]|uniref:phospholipase D family protein n=1 Tax=Rhodanobacter sp. DHG33 TaxID=2775921 RepID=UPI001783730F|nr:phospholipase D family protein [Rhodanobacter sp. DHG33]MBD8900447.1 phospholipase D family protein [Rhodanobacter sp. DHG33]